MSGEEGRSGGPRKEEESPRNGAHRAVAAVRLSKEDILSKLQDNGSSPGETDAQGRDSRLESPLQADEVDEEDSERVSEHLQQLGARLECNLIVPGRRVLPALEAEVSVPGMPYCPEDVPSWAGVAEQVLLGNSMARSDYCDKMSVCGFGGSVGRISRKGSVVLGGEQERRSIDQLDVAGRLSTSPALEVTAERKENLYVRLLLPSYALAVRASTNFEVVQAVKLITSILLLRQQFVMKWHIHDSPAVRSPNPSPDSWASLEPTFHPFDCKVLPNIRGFVKMLDGVARIHSDLGELQTGAVDDGLLPLTNEATPIPSLQDYLAALKEVMIIVQSPACKTLCFQRLKYLQEKFSLHLLFNGSQELFEVRNNNHRDFYNVRKVDTHVHHSACMTQKHLLRFVRRKYKTEGKEIVAKNANGDLVTLEDIFRQELGLTAYETSIDHLDVHALSSCFKRFDLFNTKYNPFGAALLREVFLKTDNLMGGRYLAELTREVIDDLEAAKYQHVEWRVSIYGHSRTEWTKLAHWMKKHRLCSKNVRWVIQVPRLYHVFKRSGVVNSMQDYLSNIFEPVIEAVLRPQDHSEIFEMLRHCVAWDSVDDESQISKFTTSQANMPLPADWTVEDNPPYAYFMYYMYANIRALNHLFQLRGLNALPFRPHCGEAGSISHLASAGLLAEGINHGLVLKKSPVLNYLYYLWQIGIAMSPLSNNALFHEINKSPFNAFFRTGMNVSLSTDDPLMFHFTDEALLEEYSVCAHLWKLNQVDLCEIARNSVLQSNFDAQYKRHWLGAKYFKKGARGNEISSSNVPNTRLLYREETLKEELKFLRDVLMTTEEMRGLSS